MFKKLYYFLFVVVFSSGLAFAAEKDVVLSVNTMACGPDPHNVKSALSALLGVKNIQISLADKTVLVKFDDAVSNVDQMLSAMAGAGYAAVLVGGPR